eukprot:4310541-Amphidinium_carterae.1
MMLLVPDRIAYHMVHALLLMLIQLPAGTGTLDFLSFAASSADRDKSSVTVLPRDESYELPSYTTNGSLGTAALQKGNHNIQVQRCGTL